MDLFARASDLFVSVDNLSILRLLWSTLNFKTSNADLFLFENALCIGLM